MSIKDSLNAAQWEAVSYCDGPSLVIAGAGSGKTRVLTYKIAYLIEQGMAPWSILALTFTNKAAREMNERIATVVGQEAAHGIWSGTFHSIFARILRREAQFIDYSPDYTIYDTTDSRSLIKAIVKERGLDDKTYKPQTIGARISEAKNALIQPAQYLNDADIIKRDRVNGIPDTGKIYAAYCARCRAANAMDFDDLLLNTYLLLHSHPDVRQRYMERFQYILVDEYQDTNVAQHRIVSLLTTPNSRICVVGDDAQSIYSFRGARIDNILNFQRQYPSARLVKLERNYRSTQTIVEAANSLIKHNRQQVPKAVYSESEVGKPIKVLRCSTDKDEAAKVTGEICRLHRCEHVDYNSIALLYRTNAQRRSFEEAFRQAGLPYRIYGGLSFYQRKEIKDIIAYFRLICNRNDEEAFKRIINYPARGIGATTLGKLQAAASEHRVPIFDACHLGLALNRGTMAKITAFRSLIEGFEKCVSTTGGYELAKRILQETGIMADLLADTSEEGRNKMENVEELLNAIKANEEEIKSETGREIVSLKEYISQVALLTDADQHDDGEPKVTLMTVHAAKGLEFDAVFVTGMENELFPNANARFSPRDLEEERRLFYVALTRAKRFCYLTYALCRYRFGNMDFCEPSPFIDEIDNKYLDCGTAATFQQRPAIPQQRSLFDGAGDDGFAPPTWQARRRSAADGPSTRSGHMVNRNEPKPQLPEPRNFIPSKYAESRPPRPGHRIPALSVGDTITHERFGTGTVLSLEGSGDSAKACIDFREAGKKTLLLKFARITKCS